MAKSSSKAKQQLEQIRILIENKGIQVFSLLEDLPIAMCVTDRNGHFKTINEQYCLAYDYKPEELLGKHFTIVVPEARKKLLKGLHDDFINNTYELQGEWTVQGKSGDLIKILTSAAYVEDKEGVPYKVTFLVKLMESSDLEERLEKVIGLLSGEVNMLTDRQMLFHELKDQLPVQFSLSDLIGMSEINPERYRRMETLLHQDHKALNVFDILSGLLQMEESVFILDKKPLDLIRLIRKILMEHSHLQRDRNFNFLIKIQDKQAYPTESVPFEGDEIYLDLMFQNLFFFMLNTSDKQHDTEIIFRQNDHITIEINHKSHKAIKVSDEKGLLRLKHLSFLITREHGGDVTFSISRDGSYNVILLLPKPA